MEEEAEETTSFRERMEASTKRQSGATQLTIHRQVYTQDAIDEKYKVPVSSRTVCDVIKGTCKVSPKCVGSRVLDFFPIIRTVRTYQWREWAVSDVVSGLSTGFIHLPQGLGFGLLASLRPVHGLYTSFIPVLVYLLFGTSPHLSQGTNALMALLTAALLQDVAKSDPASTSSSSSSSSSTTTTTTLLPPLMHSDSHPLTPAPLTLSPSSSPYSSSSFSSPYSSSSFSSYPTPSPYSSSSFSFSSFYSSSPSSSLSNTTLSQEELLLQHKAGLAAASCLVSGLILLGMGVARMGFLTNFLPKSLMGGFTFAAAVHISVSQVIKLLNLSLPGHSGMGKIVVVVVDIFQNILDSNPADVVVGLVCMAVLLAVKIFINERLKHRLKIPVPIELIVVIVSTLVSHLADLQGRFGLGVVGKVPTGLPSPTLPPLESLPRVASQSFVIAVLTFVLSISLAKMTARVHDVTIDDNQELVAYGLCQVVGAFFQNFASCTAPPRTMVLSSLGSRTTLNGVAPALFLLLVLLLLGPYFQALPIAMLAAMILVAMKDLLLQIRTLKSLWRINKPDFFIWVVTASLGIFGSLDSGLLVGVVFSMVTVLIVSQLAKGRLLGTAKSEDLVIGLDRKRVRAIPGVKIFRFESALYYASLVRFKTQLFSQVMNPSSHPHPKHLPSSSSSTSSSSTSSSQRKDNIPLATTVLDVSATPDSAHAWPEAEEEDSDVIRHVILDCGAMVYVDVSGVELLQTIVGKFGKVGVEVWLANVPDSTLTTLRIGGVCDRDSVGQVGKARVVYSVFDALEILRRDRESGSISRSSSSSRIEVKL